MGTSYWYRLSYSQISTLDGGLYHYLDVRSEEEFKNGHMENALNVPYILNTPDGVVKNPQFINQVLANFSKEDQLIVGSQNECRAEQAAADPRDDEFRYVYSMTGGYNDWVRNGFAVEATTLDLLQEHSCYCSKRLCFDDIFGVGI